MRVGILLHSLNEALGGIGIYTSEIVRSLLEIDNSNEYILIYPGFGAARARRGQFRDCPNAVEVVTDFPRVRPPRPLRRIRGLLPLETYWDQLVIPRVAEQHRADVVFNPHLSVPIHGRFGKVMVMHNVEYHTVPHVYTRRMYSWWWVMEHVILRAADRLISLSNAMTDDVSRYVNYPIAQVRTIYHGVSDKFRIETDGARQARARAAYALPERFILFVGRLYPQKNFAALARALALVKDAIPHRLVVVGQPRYRHQRDVQLLGALGIEDRVDFLHFVPNDELPLIYNLADCFVYPSFYESFGLAQLEAMACGCPVIGANAGAIPEVTGGAALLFDPHSPQELSDAILTVTGDPEARRDLVARGLARAREFTWTRTARETLDVFKELA